MIEQEILGIVMGGVFTTAYAYSFLAEIPELLHCLLAGCLTVLVVLKVPGRWPKTMGAVLMALYPGRCDSSSAYPFVCAVPEIVLLS